MSKKAKSKRKDAYKAFLNGLVSYRTKFIDSKLRLVEKVLSDSSLGDTIRAKSSLSVLEKAALQMITDRELSSVEDLQAISESLKEAQEKRAKFKYTPKKI